MAAIAINPSIAQRLQQAPNATGHRVQELLAYLALHGISAQWLPVGGSIVTEEATVRDGQVYLELVWLKPTAQDVRKFLGYSSRQASPGTNPARNQLEN